MIITPSELFIENLQDKFSLDEIEDIKNKLQTIVMPKVNEVLRHNKFNLHLTIYFDNFPKYTNLGEIEMLDNYIFHHKCEYPQNISQEHFNTIVDLENHHGLSFVSLFAEDQVIDVVELISLLVVESGWCVQKHKHLIQIRGAIQGKS